MEVWKYEIPPRDNFELELPVQAEILTVQMQGDKACIWVKVPFTGNDSRETRRFRLAGTGHHIVTAPFEDTKYIGTVQPTPYLVFHLFEIVRK